MKVIEAILNRRSVRKYLNKAVEEKKICEILESAMAAPSAVNKQPWEFYVVKNPEMQDKLRESTPYTNFNSPLIIIVAGNKERFLPDEKEDFWVQDCSAAAQNILISAASLELGTCWCGLYPKTEAVRAVRDILSLSEDIIPLALIHIGYPESEIDARTQYNEDYVHIIE